MQESFCGQWQWSDTWPSWVISLFLHLHTPFPSFSPSLISGLVVSVDVIHHVYLLLLTITQPSASSGTTKWGTQEMEWSMNPHYFKLVFDHAANAWSELLGNNVVEELRLRAPPDDLEIFPNQECVFTRVLFLYIFFFLPRDKSTQQWVTEDREGCMGSFGGGGRSKGQCTGLWLIAFPSWTVGITRCKISLHWQWHFIERDNCVSGFFLNPLPPPNTGRAAIHWLCLEACVGLSDS